MGGFNWRKYLSIILVLGLAVSIYYNINFYVNNKNHLKMFQDFNKQYLSTISVYGNHVANKLEEFVNLTNQQETSEIKTKLDNLWLGVIGQNRSIQPNLFLISTQHMEEVLVPDWSVIQYSLIRVDEYLYSMTRKFLEQRSYTISSEEKEKLEAIISFYRNFEPKTEINLLNLKDVIQSIQEPMLIIDENYKNILEITGNNN